MLGLTLLFCIVGWEWAGLEGWRRLHRGREKFTQLARASNFTVDLQGLLGVKNLLFYPPEAGRAYNENKPAISTKSCWSTNPANRNKEEISIHNGASGWQQVQAGPQNRLGLFRGHLPRHQHLYTRRGWVLLFLLIKNWRHPYWHQFSLQWLLS